MRSDLGMRFKPNKPLTEKNTSLIYLSIFDQRAPKIFFIIEITFIHVIEFSLGIFVQILYFLLVNAFNTRCLFYRVFYI